MILIIDGELEKVKAFLKKEKLYLKYNKLQALTSEKTVEQLFTASGDDANQAEELLAEVENIKAEKESALKILEEKLTSEKETELSELKAKLAEMADKAEKFELENKKLKVKKTETKA